ncbi:MAG: hypothetical protein AAF611_03995 [Bacteroidota bacterium]
MKKKSIKNLALNKKSISNLAESKGGNVSGQNSIRFCILSILNEKTVNVCLETRVAVLCPNETQAQGCVLTIEVDRFTNPIC